MKTDNINRQSILVIGSGAREHAIADAIERSPSNPVIHCMGTNRNPGLMGICSRSGGRFWVGNITDPVAVVGFAGDTGAELVVIGPEAPLAAGVPDALREKDISVFGPDSGLARIETSKAYARELLNKTIPEACPDFRIVSDIEEASGFLESLGENYVIKADGLTGGKGVKVAGDHLHSHDEALAYCKELLEKGKDTVEGGTFLIEEKLVGQEFSLMTITDGTTCIHFPAVQDHKRAYNGDEGPNTGGMGSYSDRDESLPFLDADDVEHACRMNEAVVGALGKEHGKPYRGILYGGFMAVSGGVKIIEYNARFGDPESLNLLTLLESDAALLFTAAAEGFLHEAEPAFSAMASVCKYVVPEGYPVSPVKGAPIDISEVPESVMLYLGSVDSTDGKLVTGGSRTAAVVALGKTIAEAEKAAETAVQRIGGKLFHRTDIGTKELIDKRIEHMRGLRNR